MFLLLRKRTVSNPLCPGMSLSSLQLTEKLCCNNRILQFLIMWPSFMFFPLVFSCMWFFSPHLLFFIGSQIWILWTICTCALMWISFLKIILNNMNLALKGEHEEITPARHPRTQLCVLWSTWTNAWGIYILLVPVQRRAWHSVLLSCICLDKPDSLPDL